jgi:hypothetical protein
MPFNNGPKIVTTGLSLLADASDQLSYPGSGTAWTDVITGTTASLSGSISFTTDFQGSLVTANSSSVIIFPPSTANFGTNTFTVEFAFRPSQINGQHWILSKNSGSFPNWGVFVTGSSGSGRLVAFFNISSAVSCSLSSAQGSIVTGSNYIVDVGFNPSTAASRLYINSETAATGSANGTGSLSATAPLFFSNLNSGSNSGTVNSIFNIKAYTPKLNRGLVRQNYNAIGNRLGLPSKLWVSSVADSLLDFYPGAAAAYSLRQLSSDYDGFAIRVRRSSDNTETNIGFDNSGNLDTVTLLNFCGVGNGFVTTWYDQSGNGRDATQSTGANQPQIVSSGSVITENGKAAAQFDGINTRMIINSAISLTSHSIFNIYKPTSTITTITPTQALFSGENAPTASYYEMLYVLGSVTGALTNERQSFLSIGGSPASVYGYGETTNDISGQKLNSILYNGTTTFSFHQNSSLISLSTSGQGAFSLTVRPMDIKGIGFRNSNATMFFNGIMQELIFYSSNQSSNRTGIETNINSFYNIY